MRLADWHGLRDAGGTPAVPQPTQQGQSQATGGCAGGRLLPVWTGDVQPRMPAGRRRSQGGR
ncbi:hypothetical protein ACFL59_16055, partial [Planctomycetota bacterium]